MKSALRHLLVISAAAIAVIDARRKTRRGAGARSSPRRSTACLAGRGRGPSSDLPPASAGREGGDSLGRLRQRRRIAKERRGHLERDGRSARPRDVRLFLHRRRCSPDGPEQPAGEDRLRDQHDHQPVDHPRRRARLLRRSGCASRRDPDAALQVAVEWRDARVDGLRSAGIRRGAKSAVSSPLPSARLRERSSFVAPVRAGERHSRQSARATEDRAIPGRHAAGLRRGAHQRRRHRASRRKAPGPSAETPPSTSAICSRTSSR